MMDLTFKLEAVNGIWEDEWRAIRKKRHDQTFTNT